MRQYDTPRDKYLTDNTYRAIVQTMVGMLHQARFTPSEMREAALLASILYEEQCMTRINCTLEQARNLRVKNLLESAWEIICPLRKDNP